MTKPDRKDKWSRSEVKLRRSEKQLESAAGIMGAGAAATAGGALHQAHHGVKDEKKKFHLQQGMRDPMARVTPEHMDRETKLARRSKKRLNRAGYLGLAAGVLGTGALGAWGTSGEAKQQRRDLRRQREGLEQALKNRGVEMRVDGSRAEQRRLAAAKSGDGDRVVTKSYETVSQVKRTQPVAKSWWKAGAKKVRPDQPGYQPHPGHDLDMWGNLPKDYQSTSSFNSAPMHPVGSKAAKKARKAEARYQKTLRKKRN